MSATPKQLEVLIGFMEEHPDMAKNYIPKTTQGRQLKNKLWADIASKLNAIGLPNKSVVAWRKVWTDFKYRAKKKCSDNLLSIQKTGGGPSEETPISDLEEKAIQMASLRTSVTGSSSSCFGAGAGTGAVEMFISDSECDYVVDEVVFESPVMESPRNKIDVEPELRKRKMQNSTPVTKPKRLRRNNKVDPRVELLKAQVEADREFQRGILALLEKRNEEDARFHAKIIMLLEECNEIAAHKLERQISED